MRHPAEALFSFTGVIGPKLCLGLLWALLCLGCPLAQAAAPVAWWSFDDPNALGHDSAGTNDAEVVGAPASGAGVRNDGILLNGAGEFLQALTSSSLQITGRLTVLLWANANAMNTNYPFVYKAASWDNGQMAYLLDLAPGGYYPRFAVSSNGYANGCRTVTSPEPLTPGEWHLIAGVYDAASLSIYVDGQKKASLAYSAGVFSGTDPLYIGRSWDATWNGALDEVRIYNVALSSAEILAEFQNWKTPLKAALSHPWLRAAVGQARTNQVTLINQGYHDLSVEPLQISGEDAAYFQLLSPVGGFVLHPGLSNAVTARVRFVPNEVRPYNALLTVSSSVNSLAIPLTALCAPNQTFTLDLQQRDTAGQITVTRTAFQASQLAVLVADVWNSHPDSEMASRVDSLVPRLNQALAAARDLGISIIFCPSDCLTDYTNSPIRTNIMNLPAHAQGDNGFNPPLPPYRNSTHGRMIPIGKSVPACPKWTHQHPDVVVEPGDLASLSRQEIFDYCAENGIGYLLYAGAAANMCLASTRQFSMVPMVRYCGLEPILIRDLTDSFTLNGRSPTNYSAVDLTMTPDRGHREVLAHNETYLGSSISAIQLMQQWAPAAYTCLISGETNLLCYWQLDSKGYYRDNLDIQRTQTCWWYDQTNGLGFNLPGAIAQDTNTALQFQGSTTVLISPTYRDDIPTNSPLVSLSATNFSLEMWVQVAALDTNQWFFSHDNGLMNGVDVLLGLNQSNHFQFIVGTDLQQTGGGDILQSATTVTPDDVAANRWFHIVATHDQVQGTVALYLNGNLEAQGPHVCQPVALASAPHLGSRGVATVDAAGKVNAPGFDFFRGVLDEVAVYNAPLGSGSIRLHYQAAQGVPAQPVPLFSQTQGDVLLLSWPAFSGGLWLQASDSLSAPNWEYLTVPVLEWNGMNWAALSTTNGSRFFRLASQ